MLYQDSRSFLISRKDLDLIPVVRTKEVSPIWQGVRHADLANEIVRSVNEHGLTIVDERWLVSNSKSAMWGNVEVSSQDVRLNCGQQMTYTLGCRHGNNGEFSVSFAIGAKVSVCSNGMFVGDFVLRRRHTKSLDLAGMVDSAVEYWIPQTVQIEQAVSQMREISITTPEVSEFLFNAYEDGIIPLKFLPKVKLEWDYQKHEEFQPRTLWSLYNDFTEVAKEMPISTQTKMVRGLLPLFKKEFGFELPTPERPISDLIDIEEESLVLS